MGLWAAVTKQGRRYAPRWNPQASNSSTRTAVAPASDCESGNRKKVDQRAPPRRSCIGESARSLPVIAVPRTRRRADRSALMRVVTAPRGRAAGSRAVPSRRFVRHGRGECRHGLREAIERCPRNAGHRSGRPASRCAIPVLIIGRIPVSTTLRASIPAGVPAKLIGGSAKPPLPPCWPWLDRACRRRISRSLVRPPWRSRRGPPSR